jgi:hypothetical protein
MNSLSQSQIDSLVEIRGRFTEPKTTRFGNSFLVFLFLFAIPLFLGFAVFGEGLPHWPWSFDEWVLILICLSSIPLGLLFWNRLNLVYVFTNTSIKALRRGVPVSEISFRDIREVNLIQGKYGILHLVLHTDREELPVLVSQDLRKILINIEPDGAANSLYASRSTLG